MTETVERIDAVLSKRCRNCGERYVVRKHVAVKESTPIVSWFPFPTRTTTDEWFEVQCYNCGHTTMTEDMQDARTQ